MKNKMKYVYGLLILLAFSQCQTEVKKPKEIDWSGKEEYLQGVVLSYDTCATLDIAGNMAVVKPGLIVIPQRDLRDDYLTVYKLSNDSLLYQNVLVKKGMGPYETSHCPSFYRLKDGRFVVAAKGWDPEVFISKTSSMEELKNVTKWDRYTLPVTRRIKSVSPVLDKPESLFGTVEGAKEMFFQYQLQDSSLSFRKCTYPDSEFVPSDSVEYSYAYRGDILKHPSKDLYFYACTHGRYMYTFQFSGDSIRTVDTFFYEPPKLERETSGGRVFSFDLSHNPYGPVCCADNKYIYMLDRSHASLDKLRKRMKYKEFYPMIFSDIMYVFDWEGNPVKKYVLDHPVESYTIDPNSEYMYAVTLTKDNEDQIVLRYKL